MKIHLEFESWEEHDAYVDGQFIRRHSAVEREEVNIQEKALASVRVPDVTRRRGFSEYEIAFVKDYYQKKKIPWIAKALRRKPAAIYMLLNRLYKEGLARKSNRHGAVEES